MTNDSARGRAPRDPWRVPVLIGHIPANGMHKAIAPTDQEAKALAAIGGLRHASAIRAEFTLTPLRNDRVRVTGRLVGRVGQTCVVTLDPIDTEVDEPIDLEFAPADQLRALAWSVDDDANDETPAPDVPEPIENGAIDLGRVASDALLLGLDPYPRKPGAVFAPPPAEDDPDEHPFAALKALKPDA